MGVGFRKVWKQESAEKENLWHGQSYNLDSRDLRVSCLFVIKTFLLLSRIEKEEQKNQNMILKEYPFTPFDC
jgi:hypothetical protein